LGFTGYPTFKYNDKELSNKEYSDGVLESFLRRIPPKKRGDFGKYLRLNRLPTDKDISDYALLGYTGAKLPTDGFSIVNPFFGLVGPCEFLMELAGFRYTKKFNSEDLNIGNTVSIKAEPENQHDPKAVKISYKGEKIGYINRVLVETFHKWLDSKAKVNLTIERINGSSTRPVVYLFIRIKPR
jgi:hypothetical protein